MTLTIGILGAARIAPMACIRPARATPGVEVVAVGARDPERARLFAEKHQIPNVATGYQEILDDPAIDAVYNPLPNGLHGCWTLRALDAGKHVLCEKPFAANAAEARAVTAAVESRDRVVMEAFHYRYHPMMIRALEVLDAGEIGTIEQVNTSMCVPLPMPKDIRYQADLAGGALMDIGCYAVHLWRSLSGEEPRPTSARATKLRPGIDRAMTAQLATEEGVTGRMECSLLSARLLKLSAKVTGSKGSLTLFNPLGPHVYNRMKVVTPSGSRVEHFPRKPTYDFQMAAFRDAVERGSEFPTTPWDAIANMEVIDAIYQAAGMEPRTPTKVG